MFEARQHLAMVMAIVIIWPLFDLIALVQKISNVVVVVIVDINMQSLSNNS